MRERERERERAHKWGEGHGERGRQMTPSRLNADSRESDVGLKLTNPEIMT